MALLARERCPAAELSLVGNVACIFSVNAKVTMELHVLALVIHAAVN